MAFTAVGSCIASALFPTQQWPAGSKSLGPATLPARFSGGAVIVDFSQVTDLLAKITLDVQYSPDGVTFNSIGGFALDLPNSGCTIAPGGVGLLDPNGIPFLSTARILPIPQGNLATRALQGSVSLTSPETVGATLVLW